MKNNLKIFLVLFIGLFNLIQANTDLPKAPQGSMVYNEVEGWLSKSEIQKIDQQLIQFNDTSSNQIALVIVNDLRGYDENTFATEIGDNWGVGNKDYDNGIVILIKPTGPKNQRKIYIAVGRGLEGAITDLQAKQIVENEFIPYFKREQYFDGIQNGIAVLMSLASGEYSFETYQKQADNISFAKLLLSIAFFVGIFFLLVGRKAYSYSRSNNVSFWNALFLTSLLSQGSGRSRNSFWDDFNSGSGGFGGGGGFGGFGGGSFGGGGAGGSW